MLGAINLFDDLLQLPALGRPLHDDFLSEIGPPAFLTLPLGDERAYNWGFADATGALNGGITTVPGGVGTLGAAWNAPGTFGSNIGIGKSFYDLGCANSFSIHLLLNVSVEHTEFAYSDYDATATAGIELANNFGPWVATVNVSTTGKVTASGGTTILGKWYLISVVWDGSTLRLYQNGVQVASIAAIGTLYASGSIATLLTRPSGANQWYGKLGLFGAWPTACSTAQVSTLYNCLLTGKPFPLFAPLATTRYFPLSAGGPQSVPLPTVDVPVSAIAPTVTLGPVAPAAPTIDVVVSIVTPAVSLGAVSQAAGTIDILLSVIAPAVTLGPPTIIVPTIDIAVSASAPAITLGGVAETAGLANISLAPIAPTVALGPVLQNAPTISVAVDTSAPAISLGPAATAAGIASITLDASTPAVTLGSVSVAAPGLDVLIDVIAPATQVQAVPLSVVDLALSAVAPTPGFVGAYPTIDVWELSARDTVWILEP